MHGDRWTTKYPDKDGVLQNKKPTVSASIVEPSSSLIAATCPSASDSKFLIETP